MPTVLITGANRGLGLEFATQYSADGWNVITTVREPSPEFEALGVRVEQLDMADLNAVGRLRRKLDELDLLVANAGTYGPKDSDERREDAEAWLGIMSGQHLAPYLLARSVLPLRRAKSRQADRDQHQAWARSTTIAQAASSPIARPRRRSTWRGATSRSTSRRAGVICGRAPSRLGADAHGRQLGAPLTPDGKRRRHAPRHRRLGPDRRRRLLRLRRQRVRGSSCLRSKRCLARRDGRLYRRRAFQIVGKTNGPAKRHAVAVG